MADHRQIGLFGATTLGVGAIVGGGILALAGVAFASTGPSALLAFALNGAIAFLTAMSFARLARRFPESGGLYTYAKKLLTIEVAFVVGWVVWFASVVVGVLYAVGFSAFLAQGLGRLVELGGGTANWFRGSAGQMWIALAAVALYTLALTRRAGGNGNAATIGKVIVFAVLIAGGVWAWIRGSSLEPLGGLRSFFSGGSAGLVRAMGYSFVALQGFDLIAAISGEVRDPARTVPRAMYLSLGCALLIYLPLLFLITTVGAPAEGGIVAAASANPEGLVAEAAERFLGASGFWLVILAGLLSMASALRANLLAASRVAFSMARDETLPRTLGLLHKTSGLPAIAVGVTGALVVVIVVAVGDVAAAGAASSLIFLFSFAMVHGAAILDGRRSGRGESAVLPAFGAVLCLGLAVFQALAVPAAGRVVAVWLALGVGLYLTLFAPGARLADVRAVARDPDLARFRGRSPLVLVPVSNPASAASLVDVAGTLRTPGVGRILLLSVVKTADETLTEDDPALGNAKHVLGESLQRSLRRSLPAETLFTIAPDTWIEIARVARTYACETVLLGLPHVMGSEVEARVEALVATLDADVVVVRAPHRWRMDSARRVLVPLGGRRDHSRLRARLLASLSRFEGRSLTFLGTVPSGTPAADRARVHRDLSELVRDEVGDRYEVVVEEADQPSEAVIRWAEDADLVVVGMQRRGRAVRALGQLPLALVEQTDVPLVLIGARPA